MKSFEIARSIRRTAGRSMAEQVHTGRSEKGRRSQACRREIEEAMAGGDEATGLPMRLVGGKRHTAMRALKREKGGSVIPKGVYCYDGKGKCPYHDIIEGKPRQSNGFCWFLEEGDWTEGAFGMLWDACKSCGINDGLEEGDLK